MSADAAIQGAMHAGAIRRRCKRRTQPPMRPRPRKSRKQFEGVLMSQMLNEHVRRHQDRRPVRRRPGRRDVPLADGGRIRQADRNQGGFGLSAAITKQLLAHQETRTMSEPDEPEDRTRHLRWRPPDRSAGSDIAALEARQSAAMRTIDPEIQKLTALYSREAAGLNPDAAKASPAPICANVCSL